MKGQLTAFGHCRVPALERHRPLRHGAARLLPYSFDMSNKSLWLQRGPASRCARAALLWGVLAAFTLMLAVFVLTRGNVSWWGQVGLTAAPVLIGALALIYGASYRVHRVRESRGE